MNQQDRQFIDQLTQQGNQFQISTANQEKQFGQNLNQQRQEATGKVYTGGENGQWLDTLAKQQLGQQGSQFDASQLQDQTQFTQRQGQDQSQFNTSAAQQLASIMGTDASGNRTLAGQQATVDQQSQLAALLTGLVGNNKTLDQLTAGMESSDPTEKALTARSMEALNALLESLGLTGGLTTT